MPSSFSWLDFSERDRRRALDVINLFSERDTRDDLGLGTVRDAWSDLLFPGTSTVMTRVRYYLFVPWMYRELEEKQVASAKIADRGRREELRLIGHLLEAGEKDGVIGIEAGKTLKILPSSIYWTGMSRWGIRQFNGSQERYHRSLGHYYARQRDHRDRGEDREGARPPLSNWHPGIPAPPSGFPETASLQLRRIEAEYLRDRILERTPGTLLAHLVSECTPWDRVDFAWLHRDTASLPKKLRVQLDHARRFSDCLHGAALLYNLMLARKAEHLEWTDGYEGWFAHWADGMDDHRNEISGWDRREFWRIVEGENPGIPAQTRSFVDRWIGLILSAVTAHQLANSQDAQRMIEDRERTLKRKRARLQNPRQLELWQGAAGVAQLDFRWRATQRLLEDVVEALHREADDAVAA